MNRLVDLVRTLNLFVVLCDLLGLVAVVAVVLGGTSLPALILMWVAAAVVSVATVRGVVIAFRDGQPAKAAVGQFLLARLELTIAALAASEDAPVPGIIAIGCLGVLALAEQMMARPVRGAKNAIANVPGWSVVPPEPTWPNVLAAVNLVAMLTALACVTFRWPLGIVWVAVAAALVCTVVPGVIIVRYLVASLRSERHLSKIIRGLKPEFLFHWQAPAGTAYQAAMWLPYFERIGRPYFVLVRTMANFAEVIKLTDAPVILRVNLEELDPLIVGSLKVAFYANTAVRNSHMIRFTQLQHIQLNHGDSDKIASVNPTFRQYDKNFVAGQAAIDRFTQHGVYMRPDQFVIVGRPQLEDVRVATAPVSSIERPTVLYAPTWSGFYENSDYSSLPAGPEIVRALLDRGCRVVFRPHPYARRHPGNTAACDAIIDMLSKAGGDHIFGSAAETEMSIVDCFNASDALISDVSSVVSDYLISDKPFIMAAVSVPASEFTAEFPQARAAYIIDVKNGRAGRLTEALDAMLGDDPMADIRQSVKAYYLGDVPPEQCVGHFVDEVMTFLK